MPGLPNLQTVALDIVRRWKTTPIHELERYMRCRHCSELQAYPFKRSHLVALRPTKISANNPPSTWWPGNDKLRMDIDWRLLETFSFNDSPALADELIGLVP